MVGHYHRWHQRITALLSALLLVAPLLASPRALAVRITIESSESGLRVDLPEPLAEVIENIQ